MTRTHLTTLCKEWVSPVFHQGQGWAQAPKPVTITTSPYLLRLSLKRLEVVGDILQLLLQLRTLTVNVLNTAGEEREEGENKKKRERETHRRELNLYGERAGRHTGAERSSRVT